MQSDSDAPPRAFVFFLPPIGVAPAGPSEVLCPRRRGGIAPGRCFDERVTFGCLCAAGLRAERVIPPADDEGPGGDDGARYCADCGRGPLDKRAKTGRCRVCALLVSQPSGVAAARAARRGAGGG